MKDTNKPFIRYCQIDPNSPTWNSNNDHTKMFVHLPKIGVVTSVMTLRAIQKFQERVSKAIQER